MRGLPACLLAVSLLMASCGGAAQSRRSGAPVSIRIEAVDGGIIDIARYRGKLVVLHLFTTWSLAAQKDVSQLIAAHTAYPDDVVVVGIALDPDGYPLVVPWRRASNVSYLVGIGSADLVTGGSALGPITEVPTTVILDRRGHIAERIGRALGDGELARLLARLGTGQ